MNQQINHHDHSFNPHDYLRFKTMSENVQKIEIISCLEGFKYRFDEMCTSAITTATSKKAAAAVGAFQYKIEAE